MISRKLFRKRKVANSRKPVKNTKRSAGNKGFWSSFTDQRIGYVIAVLLLIFTIYLTIAFISFIFSGDADQSKLDIKWRELVFNPDIKVENKAGKTGAWLADVIINRGFGVSSFISIYLMLILILRMVGFKIKNFWKNIALSLISILWISVTLGLIFESNKTGAFIYPGGKYGFIVSNWISSMTGKTGTGLLLLATGFLVAAISFKKFLPWMMHKTRPREKPITGEL